MLGVSQRCISKILRCNREIGRPHQRKHGCLMKISTPREDRQLLWMVKTNRFISTPPLRMQMIRRFGRRMSVRTIRRRLLVSGGGGTVCGTSDNGDTVSSVMSPGSPYTSVTVGSGCALGKGRGWMMPVSNLMMEIAARQSWHGCNPPRKEEWAGRGGWSHEPASVHPDPEESNVAMGDGGVWT